jgi:hypothetical protein
VRDLRKTCGSKFRKIAATDIGCLRDYQAQYLWKRIASLGWKTREPADTDFPHETPTLFPRVVNLHREDLGYGMGELSELLRLEPNDLRALYGIQEATTAPQFLRVVR